MKRFQYREYLQNREIEPSSGSWEKLEKQLTVYETSQKSRNWMVLKIASVILLLISVGIYFFQPQQNKLPSQEIAAPVSKEDLIGIPKNEVETEIAEKSIDPEIEISKSVKNPQSLDNQNDFDIAENRKETETLKNSFINEEKWGPKSEKISSSTSDTNFIAGFDQGLKTGDYDSVSEKLPTSGHLSNEDELLNAEIDQLLHDSKLKLIVNGQISPKKYVNTNALLNSVEDDLDKDLRQKLIEKIVNTLKKDNEVVTSEEN
ncbi:hypothetical protein LCM02_11805 [Lutimonas saemankumensis]|uniref:hypothetical protein n=1 Tax=Lutimonas saemankumensis TaxID=483016 RepID=UPI001CD3A3AE|nr:hypothetical protein [Lutimonas saemankumensis]MCA0933140.1 hypothetical protein [Lutimonas saemankumensis]